MKLSVCWMYHDIMDLYGDKGNMMVLEKRCKDRGIDFILDTCTIGEEKDLSTYDLLFIGGGADKEQHMLIDDLLSRKDNIKKAMDSNTFILLICGGYQLFGQYYIDADNNKIECLRFFDYYTENCEDKKRCIGNIAINCKLEDQEFMVVGFENHGGQTQNVKQPFGQVVAGHGNNFEEKIEGFYNGQVLGTYMHGPLLPKNPKVADFIIYKSIQKHNPEFQLKDLLPLDDSLENKAKNQMLQRLQVL